MMEQEAVLQIFKELVPSPDGAIGKDDMRKLIKLLDGPDWTDDRVELLLKGAKCDENERIEYEKFFGWLFAMKTYAPGEEGAKSPPWGDWMGAWKVEAGAVDEEADRLSRQAAAFGGDTVARLKDLNVLIIGCRGVGVEAAKNLILTNVGSVTIWDPTPACVEDLGTNFYLNSESVGKPRDVEVLPQLKSLNPYCKVEVLEAEEAVLPGVMETASVLATGSGYSCVVVTRLLPQETLFKLNAEARSRGIAFLFAANMGVTSCFFSDFGPKHAITDEDGEPTQMLAVSAAEVITIGGISKVSGVPEGGKALVLTLAADHGLADGDMVALDDMRGALASYNGKQFKVKRFAILSPNEAKVDIKDVGVKEMLKQTTSEVLANFSKQHDYYNAEWQKAGVEGKFNVREITLFNRLCLVLGEGQSVDDWAGYQSGGLVNSVKPVIVKDYQTLEQSLVYTPCPQMMDQEAWQNGEGCWVHIALSTALKYQAAKGTWPKLHDDGDAEDFVALAKKLSEERKELEGGCWLQKIALGFPSGESLENLEQVAANLKRFSLLFTAELTGFCAFLGGVAAQEVIKKTGKFTPIEQWIHHDDPVLFDAAAADFGSYAGTRYTNQVAVIGPTVMEALTKQKIFLVGCGALGCEYLKGLSLMGACTAEGSKLVVTDMDSIEVSNLSRQFLFRQSDVGNPKSVTAARVVKGWNPDIKIEAIEKGVGTASEDFFSDSFWGSLNLCWNALDNVVARKYTDRCCLWYGLPLLESGTLGTKSNSDVFLPKLTKSYNDGQEDDANETQIAMCTLRSFPYLPLHCIEFAKQAFFADYMEFAPRQYEALRTDPASFFQQLESMSDAEQFKALKMIQNFIALQSSGKVDFSACIKSAFGHYCNDFIFSIRDLVWNCDQLEKSTGKRFWTGTKRKPLEAKWDSASPPAEALEYLYASANCYAFMWRVPYVRNRGKFTQMVVDMKLVLPEWSAPSEGNVDEEEDAAKIDPEQINAMKGELYAVDLKTLQECEIHDFEKDDDANFHIDFLTSATNMRARNYDIKLSERAHVKVTAGRIIPALATTTAMICGLVDVEFLKIVKGLHLCENPLDQFYNANVNLATGSQAMNLFRPETTIKKETKLEALPMFTTWDKIEIQGEITVAELITEMETRYGVKVQRLFPKGDDKAALFDQVEVAKQDWKIEMNEDGTVKVEPDAVYTAWPQLRMAVQMLGRLPAGPARANFEKQLSSAASSLQSVKDTFSGRFNGPVSAAFVTACRPADTEADKQKYFDEVYNARPYLALHANVLNPAGEETEVPFIKYSFR